jgi:hypothetical protein
MSKDKLYDKLSRLAAYRDLPYGLKKGKTMSNDKRNPVTLTFFTLEDFISELRRRGTEAVRCEAVHKDEGKSQLGTLRTYKVVLTVFDSNTGEVLVCSIVTGRCWTFLVEHEPYHSENLGLAGKLVRAYLEGGGFAVRPGIYRHDEDGIASCGLWHIDDEHRLVAEEVAHAG